MSKYCVAAHRSTRPGINPRYEVEAEPNNAKEIGTGHRTAVDTLSGREICFSIHHMSRLCPYNAGTWRMPQSASRLSAQRQIGLLHMSPRYPVTGAGVVGTQHTADSTTRTRHTAITPSVVTQRTPGTEGDDDCDGFKKQALLQSERTITGKRSRRE